MSRNSFRDYFDQLIACSQPNIAMVIQDAIAFLEGVESNGID
ncbi:hypothetical protein [Pseudanabaena sp. SR411]|nr:hypothetical protein [Pseudanabaena sp. SR411]